MAENATKEQRMEDDFDKAADEAAASLEAALGQVGQGAEPPAAAPADQAAPAGAGDGVPGDGSAKPSESDDEEGDGDGEGADPDDDEGDDDADARTLELQETLRAKDEEIARLKAEKEAKPAAAPAEGDGKETSPASAKDEPKGEEPKVETYDEMMDRISKTTDPSKLSADDREVRSRLSTLIEQEKAFIALKSKVADSSKKESELVREKERLALLVKDAEEAVAEDELDSGAARRLEKHRAALSATERQIRDEKVNRIELVQKVSAEERLLNNGIRELDEDTRAYHHEISAANTRKGRTEQLQSAWQKGLTTAFEAQNTSLAARKERKFDVDEQASITEHYQSLLNAHIREHGAAPADLVSWISEQKAPFERASRIRKSSGANVAARVAALEPGRPADPKSPRRGRGEGKSRERSFEDEFEASGAKLDRLLNAS